MGAASNADTERAQSSNSELHSESDNASDDSVLLQGVVSRPIVDTTEAAAAQALPAVKWYYIPLPKHHNAPLWRYFALRSVDNRTVDAENSSFVYCTVEKCTQSKVKYCGNTTNLVTHLSKNHPKQHYAYLTDGKSESTLIL